MANHCTPRADAGLIIAEAATSNQVGLRYPNIPVIYSDSHVAG